MKIEPRKLTIREVTEGYKDNAEEGVVGYGGKLNIRPPYQREFVYKEKERNAVLSTIRSGFPLNVMYWAVNEDGTFEVLDGQQRTISFCQYVDNVFSIDDRAFNNLTSTEKERILDYELMVYFCEGTEEEKLNWFEVVNIAGLKLTDQELKNAVYTGAWLTHAKSIFSKNNCAAYNLANKYLMGECNRQTYLETALSWINGGEIKAYMSKHQHSPNANELWTYFQNVINWIRLTFPEYRREMKGIDWGSLYNEYRTMIYDTAALEKEIQGLMMDDDVTSRKGIYTYVLTRNEKHLSIRAFNDNQKRAAYERQGGICPDCKEHFPILSMEADHISPWSQGGKTIPENCKMRCKECNRRKSDI